MKLDLSEWSCMDEEARDVALDDLVRAARQPRTAEQAAVLDARIAEHEKRSGMTSDEMRAGLRAGTIPDTCETSRWLILLRMRDRQAWVRRRG